ncbi:hypothetical protein PGT21_036828 [Puccinia graminis f. sp. tritici]|nr:hypothetical protein PGTUg99_000060 [Puccinia graminis f. sp. tritici]KAA1106653.1 hypothetical protein PGT21_036828 [Puccinia graminis f. sp. tritici]
MNFFHLKSQTPLHKVGAGGASHYGEALTKDLNLILNSLWKLRGGATIYHKHAIFHVS